MKRNKLLILGLAYVAVAAFIFTIPFLYGCSDNGSPPTPPPELPIVIEPPIELVLPEESGINMSSERNAIGITQEWMIAWNVPVFTKPEFDMFYTHVKRGGNPESPEMNPSIKRLYMITWESFNGSEKTEEWCFFVLDIVKINIEELIRKRIENEIEFIEMDSSRNP